MKKIALSISMVFALTFGGCTSSSSSADANTTNTADGNTTDIGGEDTNEITLVCDGKIPGSTLPTAEQLAKYAGTYSGNVGSYNDAYEFIPSGDAVIEYTKEGGFTYNGKAYTPIQTCYIPAENNGVYGAMIMVELSSESHVDLFGEFKFSGISPEDGKIMTNL